MYVISKGEQWLTNGKSSYHTVCYYNKWVNYDNLLLPILVSVDLLCLFSTEWPPSSLLLCWPAHPAPPQVLWGGGVWCGSRHDAPQPATLHPSVSTSSGCSPSHTARYAWVISCILLRSLQSKCRPDCVCLHKFVSCLCSAPRSKTKRYCQNNAQCYGGSGGILLLLGLLALAIWLGGTLRLFIQIALHYIDVLFWFIHNYV